MSLGFVVVSVPEGRLVVLLLLALFTLPSTRDRVPMPVRSKTISSSGPLVDHLQVTELTDAASEEENMPARLDVLWLA